MSVEQAAQIVEHFLDGSSLYPQKWHDFVETPQRNGAVESFRCYQLDPPVDKPGSPDASAVAELRQILTVLRSQT
jgi:hypothetical protein